MNTQPITIPMNDIRRTYETHGAELETQISAVVRSGWYLSGEKTTAFARSFADYLGVKHCLPVGNGTDALEIALRCVAPPRNDGKPAEVINVANAGGYATTACLQLGLQPVFVDIEEDSQLLSIDAAVAALTPRTAALLATHLYGGLVDVPRLRGAMNAAGFAHVPIIEDCAQAHGLAGSGGRAGAMGDLATFSFYPTKNLGAFGDAGAVVTSDETLFQRLRRLHQYGWVPGAKYRIELAGGRNSRMDEIQAAVLWALLPYLEDWNRKRLAILERYENAAPNDIRFIRSPQGTVAHLAVALSDHRDALRQHITERGIATEIHYPTLDCDQPGWPGLSEAGENLPVARGSVGRLLTLPCFPAMTDDEIDRVCDALREWNRR